MRLAFLGTPEAAVPSLRALVEAGHDVRIVITRPDRRRGRGSGLSPSAVKIAAEELGLVVGYALSDLDGADVERGVVVAYGALIPGSVLSRIPMLNVHFSLLPRWRGAAPVERAILAGDEFTGVSVMSLEVQLDSGPVHAMRRVTVGNKTASELTSELAQLGAAGLVDVLSSRELLGHASAQEGEATYAQKLTKETFHLVPTMSPTSLLATVRLERAFTFVNGRRVGIRRAHEIDAPPGDAGTLAIVDGVITLVCSGGTVALDMVQPEGSKLMTAEAWRSGARVDVGLGAWA